jgi:hypothetical protein
MDAYEPMTSHHDTHADARLRLDARRQREAAQGPEVRALLTRAEAHLQELRGAAEMLAGILPTRVEAAVARALDEGGLDRRLDGVRGEVRDTGAAVARIEQDLLAERVARIEDLELVIDLLAQGLGAVRTDVVRLSERLEGIAARIDEPLQVTVERPRQAGLRHLFAPTEPARENGASGESGGDAAWPAS